MDLTQEQRSQYIALIDTILRDSDLATISTKQIRQRLEEKLGHDISDQKAAVKALIFERFDNANQNAAQATSNGSPSNAFQTDNEIPIRSVAKEDDESDVGARPPKKKARQSHEDSDAKLAALLQAQENGRNRPTRGGVSKKPSKVQKKTSPKKKSAAKIKADDDSDMELDSNGEKKEVVRKGGFHKQYYLSTPLAELVGEAQLSRPQVVKKIWEYIKARDLQDPADKRQIRCDERMHAVFKSDRVHMFTMNKILGHQLYPVEEA